MYPALDPPSTGVKLKFSTTTLAEIALQIGTSCTMVIKVPLPGLGLVGVVVEQLVKTPATSTTPIIFASLLWGVRLKSLLQFTSGIGTQPRQPGDPGLRPGGSQHRPAPLPQMMLASHGVFRMLGPQSQDSDKYSELTAEGKRNSTDEAPCALVAGCLNAPPGPRESPSAPGCPNQPNLRTLNATLPQVTPPRRL